MTTKEKIASKALEMFNDRGIEYVGLREIAATLNMRVSNITYYYPTKDDLVAHLSAELRHENSLVVVENDDLTMTAFLNMFLGVFQNHVRYRCLLLSFVHVMEQNKMLSSRYKETAHKRNATLKSNLETLSAKGYLYFEDEKTLDFLVSVLSLIVRFWISEAAVSFKHLNTQEQIDHYADMIATLVSPYATVLGKKEIQLFLTRK